MCLIITAPAGVTVEDEWLRDFYQRNNDGYGFMYAHDNQLHVLKRLGTAEQFIADWRSLEQYDRAVHLRMRTHGDIDLVNCHPYWVTGYDNDSELPLAMMHNGILASGNDVDPTKSDTWHYINDVLKPLLAKYPHLIQDPVFQRLVEEHIDSNNRFVFLDSLGRMVTLNYGEGVLWEGMWLSNTYAWSAPLDEKTRRYYGGYDYDDWGYNYGGTGYGGSVGQHEIQTRPQVRQTGEKEDFDIVVVDGNYDDEGLVYELCDRLYQNGFQRAGNADELLLKFLDIYGTASLLDLVEPLLERSCSEEVFLDTVHARINSAGIYAPEYGGADGVEGNTIPLFDRSVTYGT